MPPGIGYGGGLQHFGGMMNLGLGPQPQQAPQMMPNPGFRQAPDLAQIMPEMRPQANVPTAQNAVPNPTMQSKVMGMLQNPELQKLIGQMNQPPQFAPGQIQMPNNQHLFQQFQMPQLSSGMGGMPGLFGRME